MSDSREAAETSQTNAAPTANISDHNAPGLPTVHQAETLIGYVAQRGIQSPAVSELCQRIAGQAKTAALGIEAITAYTEISKLTAPVSGASILDSEKVDYFVRRLQRWTIIILVLVLTNGAMGIWIGNNPKLENSNFFWLSHLQTLLEYPSPFLWGALGSCVYLLKRFSDLAEARQFDEDSLHGWGTRIMLGAILGGIIQFIYDPKSFTTAGVTLNANALGFLSGVGVKLVYGAIEKTITALSGAMNLDAVKTGGTGAGADATSQFLAEQMAKETDEAKRKALLELIEKWRAPK